MAILYQMFPRRAIVITAVCASLAPCMLADPMQDGWGDCEENTADAYSAEMMDIRCQKYPSRILGCDTQKVLTSSSAGLVHAKGYYEQCAEGNAAGYSQELKLRCCSKHTARIRGCIEWNGPAIFMAVPVALFVLVSIHSFMRQLYTSLGPGIVALQAWLIPPIFRGYEYQGHTGSSNGVQRVAFGMASLTGLLRSQALLNRLVLCIGVFTVLCTGHTSVSPAVTAGIALPNIIRSRAVGVGLMHHEDFNHHEMPMLSDAQHMFFATLESFDDYSDGVVIGAMILQDHVVHARFVGSFLYSSWGWVRALAPAMDILHMWGLALSWLLLAQASQWNEAEHAARWDFQPDHGNDATALEAVGLNVLAERRFKLRDDPPNNDGGRQHNAANIARKKMEAIGFSRVLLENCSSGLIASSFVMFTGVSSLLDQPIGLFCSVLSIAALLKKAFDFWRKHSMYTYSVASFLVAAEITAKLWGIQTCPDHAWELTAGCMQLD